MNKNEILLLSAEHLSKEYHSGQKYGDDDYFLTHIEDVVSETAALLNKFFVTNKDCESVLCVAYLHDILEDTSCTIDTLLVYFSRDVVNSVLKLSKNLCVKETYLENIKSDRYARVVKIADSRSNMNACIKQGDFNRAKKYLKNLCYLES